MKKLNDILIFIVGNVFIYFICIVVYEFIIFKVEKNYQNNLGLIPGFLVVLVNFILFIVYFYKLRFNQLHWFIKKFGISIIPLGTLLIQSIYMKLDQIIILDSFYKNYEYKQSNKLFQLFEESDCTVIIDSENYWSYSVPLRIEDCIEFDSIQVKINKGIFGGSSFFKRL